jgi:hypothetical protein
MNLWVGTSLMTTAWLEGATGAHPVAATPAASTASPNVTLFDYLAIPAITGAAIAFLSFLLSVWLIRRADNKTGQVPFGLWDWLRRPIIGAGAWTANDSWATNISTGLVVVAAVLGATTAAGGLFVQNLKLDPFSFVNIAAGSLVAAAPVLFGILYASFTTRNPGLIADAIVKLPGLRTAAINAPSGASITVAMDTTMADGSAHWATVRGGGSYQIPPGTAIEVLIGVSAAARTCADAGRSAFLQAILVAGVPADPTAMSTDVQALTLAVEQAFVNALRQLDLPDGEEAARAIIVPALRTALDGVGAAADMLVTNAVRSLRQRQARKLAAAGQAIIASMKESVPQICSLAPDGAMAYAGAADIAVLPGSTIYLSAPVDSLAGTVTIQASDVVAPAPQPPQPPGSIPRAPRHVHLVEVVPQAPAAPADVPLTQPILIDAAGGAKITVTGAADVSLPKNAVISAPGHRDYPLTRPRQLLAPQGTNLIVASLGIILSVNILTMFGIGAELGIAGVLASFSKANTPGLACITAALAVIAIVVILYAGTAARAMADPQPGSSISSQAGTSFTL